VISERIRMILFSMGSVKKLLEEQIPGVYVVSLMIGTVFCTRLYSVQYTLYKY
jgi:hypothetical protein